MLFGSGAGLLHRAVDARNSGFRATFQGSRTGGRLSRRPGADFARTAAGSDVYDAALTNVCDAQITVRRLQEALATCGRLTEMHPDRAVVFYNLAGVYGLLGRDDEALAALERDLALGDRDWEYLAADPWFERLRAHPRFAAIVAEMKRRSAAAAS